MTQVFPVPPIPGPPIAAYTPELLRLLVPQRGPVTLTPSIAISEEYNDNIFSNNAIRQWDFITSLTPAITLVVNRPSLQLSAGYSVSADVYAREHELTRGLDRQTFVANGSYAVAAGLTVSASDTFRYNLNTNLVGSQTFSTGRQESWSNDFTPGLTWQMTPRTYLSLSANYSLLRFQGDGGAIDSDTYGFQGSLGHAFTPRLSGFLSYAFTYLDPQGQESSMTHTPTLGFTYQITRTLTGSVSGGASITELGREATLSPAGSVSLAQDLGFGSASVQYSRGVYVAGGFGGTTDTQTFSGALTLSTLARGLVLVFNPRYSIAESVSRQQTGQVDVKALTLYLAANYQIAQFASLFGEYQFFRQRTGGASSAQIDVDQNRVRFGLQFGYPFTFD